MVTYISLVNAIPTWMYLNLQIFSTEPKLYIIILWHCTCTTTRQYMSFYIYVVFLPIYCMCSFSTRSICPTKARVFWKASRCMESKEKNHSKIHRRYASHVCVCVSNRIQRISSTVLLYVFYCAIHFRTWTYKLSSRIWAICAYVI